MLLVWTFPRRYSPKAPSVPVEETGSSTGGNPEAFADLIYGTQQPDKEVLHRFPSVRAARLVPKRSIVLNQCRTRKLGTYTGQAVEAINPDYKTKRIFPALPFSTARCRGSLAETGPKSHDAARRCRRCYENTGRRQAAQAAPAKPEEAGAGQVMAAEQPAVTRQRNCAGTSIFRFAETQARAREGGTSVREYGAKTLWIVRVWFVKNLQISSILCTSQVAKSTT
jgi:hypothetical protein